jgi:MSHA biogenesis protein MshK
MDRLMKPRRGVRWSLPALGLALPALALAQVADPTLPPPSLQAPGAPAPAVVAPALPELQSILVSREAGGRRVAVISGETVRQGGRYRGAVVESVGETFVVLRRGHTRETLRLFQGRSQVATAQPAETTPAAPPVPPVNTKKEMQ